MIKTILISAGVALFVVVLGFAFFGQPSEKTIVERIIERVGSVVGPDISHECLNIAGVRTCWLSQSFVQASTTACSFHMDRFSRTATTSLIALTVMGTQATATAMTWNVATSTTAFATTTPIIPEQPVPATRQFSFDIARATTSMLLATSTFINVEGRRTDAENSGYIGQSLAGRCTVTYQEL